MILEILSNSRIESTCRTSKTCLSGKESKTWEGDNSFPDRQVFDSSASAFNPRIRQYLQDHGVTYEDKNLHRRNNIGHESLKRQLRFSPLLASICVRSDLHRLQRDQVSSGDVRLNAQGTVRKHLCVLTGFGRTSGPITRSSIVGENIGPAMDSPTLGRRWIRANTARRIVSDFAVTECLG
ncbi:H(+)-ATPase 3 [Striga asiatica]|uniref:H(+)-ATPase 3 n=1 Tax=Striga asiatica TaxID=4170 RepID=A0A5A7P144_STRAF|nr:H(+)-ATPase 3 [Striga asiatica]